ncbi:nitroreductase family protein [Paenibacillus lautus]|uniref:nitroreductase family protein n=1 Tax=Paenibacillus lautus TaxID=1401 RepID=UPI001FD347B9|nr:nitroreductase family protein [Paenibacillus lautus]
MTIRKRRSIRTFNQTPVPRELVIQLLKDVSSPPTAQMSNDTNVFTFLSDDKNMKS